MSLYTTMLLGEKSERRRANVTKKSLAAQYLTPATTTLPFNVEDDSEDEEVTALEEDDAEREQEERGDSGEGEEEEQTKQPEEDFDSDSQAEEEEEAPPVTEPPAGPARKRLRRGAA